MNHGAFSGEPRTIWQTEANKPDRVMTLIDAFTFTDPNGVVWTAAAGDEVDGASIPRSLWSVVGSPYTGDYRRASIVHDIACLKAQGDVPARRKADKMFYHACRAGGCNSREATLLYIGVRIGAAWDAVPHWAGSTTMLAAETEFVARPRLVRAREDVRAEQDFAVIGDKVLAPGETDDIDEIERRVDQALTSVTGVDLTNR